MLATASPVNRHRGGCIRCHGSGQAPIGQLQSLLRDLGVERRQKPDADLQTYLPARATQPIGDGQPTGGIG